MSSCLGHGSFGVLDRSALSERRSRDLLAITGHVNRTEHVHCTVMHFFFARTEASEVCFVRW